VVELLSGVALVDAAARISDFVAEHPAVEAAAAAMPAVTARVTR
jgi:hypothetical protein